MREGGLGIIGGNGEQWYIGYLSVDIIAGICSITNDCTKVQNPQCMCGFPKWLQTKELADRQ